MEQNDQIFTISGLARQIKDKEVSPVELLNTLLERVKKYEGKLNTFITVMSDIAKKQALKAENEIMSGLYKGPLHGIPISIKDIISFAQIPLTNGSRVQPDYIPSTHATVTEKLLKSGAVILGKAHLHEFAYKEPHPYYQWTKNPWDLNRVPGGSSSGSGAAVQAGLVLGSIGSDTGGSIRFPASFCGVVGLKPTYGRVSRYGVTPLSWSLDHIGPLTRTCEDAAIILASIAGYDEKDRASFPRSDWDLKEFKKLDDLKGKKIGVPESFIFENLGKDTERAFRSAITTLAEAGATLIPIELKGMKELQFAQTAILISEAYSYHMNHLESHSEGYNPRLRQSFEVGQFYSAADYIQAQRCRKQMKEKFYEIFENVDCIVTPTAPDVAQKIEEYEKETSFTRGKFTYMANILGLPALSIPCGFSKENMPIGLQIIGPSCHEGEVLSIGSVFEQMNNYHKVMPDTSLWEEPAEFLT
ncbi:Asp-tRNA(Asn)/Glu-tRNA(Gln) amidotransferase GatCAB subunit A [Bacillus dakarensis]|uniref:Asp-tRNA(Asn)/Glu-tRNA(Gln) amidotransferase GatCAB subunit A n=1 Tax=Robertmurraya dakarensis TaxID=1926278 RepID=UPI0009810C21|nr:Asp-tRNA(Asn)/Glu-tRNA(Gln) amidotransferase GatCAB subunit A [Bacillus dakarensis]